METAVAEKLAATNEEAFNFASYMKERAQLVNEALDKSVPLQYPETINESMRQAHVVSLEIALLRANGIERPIDCELPGSRLNPCVEQTSHWLMSSTGWLPSPYLASAVLQAVLDR